MQHTSCWFNHFLLFPSERRFLWPPFPKMLSSIPTLSTATPPTLPLLSRSSSLLHPVFSSSCIIIGSVRTTWKGSICMKVWFVVVLSWREDGWQAVWNWPKNDLQIARFWGPELLPENTACSRGEMLNLAVTQLGRWVGGGVHVLNHCSKDSFVDLVINGVLCFPEKIF